MVGCIPEVLTLLLTPILKYICMSNVSCHKCQICHRGSTPWQPRAEIFYTVLSILYRNGISFWPNAVLKFLLFWTPLRVTAYIVKHVCAQRFLVFSCNSSSICAHVGLLLGLLLGWLLGWLVSWSVCWFVCWSVCWSVRPSVNNEFQEVYKSHLSSKLRFRKKTLM